MIASIDGAIGAYAPSPDGRRIAFVGTLHGNPERSYSQPDLWVANMGGAPRNLTAAYDFDVNGAIGGDQRAPRGQHPAGPVWSSDGRSILIKVGEQGDANLVRIDVRIDAATARVEPLTRGHHEVISYSADRRGNRFAAVLSSATAVGDLHIIDVSSPAAPKKLTGFNDALLCELTVTDPE